MSKAQLNKVEKMTIEQLKQKAPEQVARLAYNAAGMDDAKHSLIIEAIPYALYKLPTYEFRSYFVALETVSYVTGLYFWKYYTLSLLGNIKDTEFGGVVMALNDVVEHFELDQKKVALMGMGAFFDEFSDNETMQTNHCERTRKQIFNEITEGAKRMM